MYPLQSITTSRLKTSYYRAGEHNEKKLLLLHGNVSSSVFYLPLFPALSKRFDVVAIDLRCFGDSDALPVDATRGLRDWSDDLDCFVDALGWERFALGGWSMGGGIAMQYAIDHCQRLTGLILIAPLSPYGFGGTHGVSGEKLQPVGLASGAGCTNPKLIKALAEQDRAFLHVVLHSVYFNPPHHLSPEWEELLLDGMLKTKLGEGMYPGDSLRSQVWPHVISGSSGINNTMSPAYCDLSPIANLPIKPPILWVRGDADQVVSDTSICDFGFLGQSHMVPVWPGWRAFPPQPMVSQTRYVLDEYTRRGGIYCERVFPGAGHGCHLECPDGFVGALNAFL